MNCWREAKCNNLLLQWLAECLLCVDELHKRYAASFGWQPVLTRLSSTRMKAGGLQLAGISQC